MAADSVSVDALLADAVTKLDALTKRMDALEVPAGTRNPIKGDDDDDDKKSKSDGAAASAKSDDDDDDRKDDATKPKTVIKDDAGAKKAADAGFPPAKVKKDSKKRGDDGELEIKHGKEKDDSAKKSDDDDDKKDDAFPPPKKAKDDSKKSDDDDDDRRDDDDDDKKKDDSARADEISSLKKMISDQQNVIGRLEAMMKPRSDDEHAAFADAQAKADAVFNGFGERAPRPLEGESLVSYRKRLATKLKTHSQAWKAVPLSKLPEEAFSVAEVQIYADAERAAAHPVDLAEGELRMVTKIDPATGRRYNDFYGKESFVKQMGRPGRRVASFRTLASQ